MPDARALAKGLGALLLFALSACGGESSINPFKSDVIDVACPPLGALKEASAFTRFREGDGRDLTDVVLQARIGRVVAQCKVNQKTLVAEVVAGIELFGERGPAMQGFEAPIEYFVAVRNPAGEIVRRDAFALPLEFEEGVGEALALDYLEFTLQGATPEALRAYRIFFGLQMTREEWAFNQRSVRRR